MNKERTIITTIGACVIWRGRKYEIDGFKTNENNQTLAVLKNESAYVTAPIEELEAVEE